MEYYFIYLFCNRDMGYDDIDIDIEPYTGAPYFHLLVTKTMVNPLYQLVRCSILLYFNNQYEYLIYYVCFTYKLV